MIHYQVNNKQIYNPYLAYYESFQSGKPVQFYCHDAEYDQLDWTQEPAESFETLMDQHAHRLRDRYERLILAWSGGTDSHTIYNVFKRNGIHIDEILYKIDTSLWRTTNGQLIQDPTDHLNWLKANHWDPTTRITSYDEYTTDLKGIDIRNDEWIFQNRGDLGKYFAVGTGGEATKFLCERNHAGHHWGLVVGYEKPFVFKRNGSWYSRQSDVLLNSVLGQPNVESFFLEPMLHLKQSHLAKRVLKRFQNIENSENYATVVNPNGFPGGYKIWASLLGRHDELSDGISINGKFIITHMKEFAIDSSVNIGDLNNHYADPSLLGRLKKDNKIAVNYVKGLYNLASEHRFYEFLNENFLAEPGKVFKLKTTWSKEYNLGE